MRLTTDERRGHPRRELTRPCKIRLGRSGKYVAGRTRDISSGGTMIMLDRRVNLSPGDDIEVGIAWTDSGLIRADDLVPGRIVRVARTDDTEAVGVALETHQASAALAA